MLDADTGEPQDVSEEPGELALSDYTDDAIAELWEGFKAEIRKYAVLAHGAEMELIARMEDSGATVFDTDNWEGNLTPGQILNSVDDPQRLRQRLGEHLKAKELQRGFYVLTPRLVCRQAVLNDWHKRGGLIAQVIDEERSRVRGRPELKLKRKEADGR